MTFDGKVIVVTGGARGIGQAISKRFFQLGGKVAVLGRNIENAEAFAKALDASGEKVQAFKCDVANAENISETISAVEKAFGQIDVLVNNAGVTQDGLLVRMKDDQWDVVLETNLSGPFRLMRAVARGMLKKRSGAIVNVSSTVGVVGNAGQANYVSAKAGLIGLTKSAAREFGPRGVRVNAVAPGLIETDMTSVMNDEQRDAFTKGLALGRAGTPDDVAGAVAFLASEDASYITGQTLNVCGGFVM